jgi:ubiquinone biosynthesis protein
MYLEMIFRDSFYHADPHPGNLMLLPEQVVGVMDCGMAGRINDSLRDDIEALLMAVVEKDAGQVTNVVLRLGSVPPDCPRDQLRADLDDYIADYVSRPLPDLDLSAALNSLAEIIHRYSIALPPGLSLLLRTLVLLEGTSRLLSPSFSLAELIRPFYFKSVQRRFSPPKLWAKLARSFRDWDRLIAVLPRDLSDVLSRIRDGTFNVHLDHRHLDPVVNRLVLGILTAAVFLGSSLLWSMKAPPLIKEVSVFGAAGYLLAVHLGWRLYRAMKKSGDINSKD